MDAGGRVGDWQKQIPFGNDKQWNRQRRNAGVPVRLAALAQGRLSTSPLRGFGRDDGGVGGTANDGTGNDVSVALDMEQRVWIEGLVAPTNPNQELRGAGGVGIIDAAVMGDRRDRSVMYQGFAEVEAEHDVACGVELEYASDVSPELVYEVCRPGCTSYES